MAKAVSEKKYITFVKGLITEANALTFPENASLDEDNFDLHNDGSRSRRLGLDYESGYTLTATGISSTIVTGTKESFHKWNFPDGSTEVSIGVVRVYNKLWFINLLAAVPSASLLNGGAAVTISGLANANIETSTINGYFVIVSEDLSWPIVLTYNKLTQVVSQESFPIQIRDFWGVSDGLTITERPIAPITDTHYYNLLNQGWSPNITVGGVVKTTWLGLGYRTYYLTPAGWVTTPPVTLVTNDAIAQTEIQLGVFPSNADVWTFGKIGVSTDANYQKYSPAALALNSIINMEAPKGSFIIDAFARGSSRKDLSGLTLLPIDREEGKITTTAIYAGRVFYSGIVSSTEGADGRSPNFSGAVFYSQIISGKDKLGKCYQEADPTSEDISDIIDTDGGVLLLPEASRIIKLLPVKDSLLIFAENGIWELYSDTGGFTATSYQVSKVSTTGVTNAKTIVAAGDTAVYWANAGIFAASPNPQTGRYQGVSISLSTIQTYYVDDISDLAKSTAKGFFDEKENHVRWLYNDSLTYSDIVNVNHYNRILNLDLTLQSFYKYSIGSISGTSPAIVDFIEIPSHAIASLTEDVYVGNDAVLSVADQVQVPISSSSTRDSTSNFLTFVGQSFTISKYKDTTFVDWKTANGVGVDAPAYLITGYETFGDITRTKQVPYIWFYLNRTETGFVSSGGGLAAVNPSSCLVQARWNWSNSDAQGKWGTQFQVYRYLKPYIPSGVGDTYDTGDSIIVTKNKFRGSGKALSLKISTEAGKDLQLLGWSLIVTGDGTP